MLLSYVPDQLLAQCYELKEYNTHFFGSFEGIDRPLLSMSNRHFLRWHSRKSTTVSFNSYTFGAGC
jgi:hypothetical protein